jgi:uncharacterized ion transporter superfamily protein YfcC
MFRVPHTLVLLFVLIAAAVALTHVLPAGRFERVENAQGRLQVVADSYRRAPEAAAVPVYAVFTAVPRGMGAAAEIIFLVFIVGGAFAVLRASGAVDALLGAAIRRLGHRPLLLIVGGILLFTVGSSTIGMAEEYLPFVPVLVALALALRYDAVTGVAILTVGYSIGYGTAAINPFTVLIAQDVAGLQPASGLWFRLVLVPVFVPLGVFHVWRYARRVEADPSSSLVAGLDRLRWHEPVGAGAVLTARHGLVLAAVAAALALLVYGLAARGWYLTEMSGLFLGLTVAMAALARLSPDRTARAFGEGAAELTVTALLIGFARAIQVVLEDGGVIDTIVHGLSLPLRALGPSAAAVGMFLVQAVTNLFIPSGSGQAYVTMPIMAPLADVVGVSRQVAVLAFQFGDGFTNILVPTSPVTIGILASAGVPYERWLRFVVPFMIHVFLVGALVLVAAVWLGLR